MSLSSTLHLPKDCFQVHILIGQDLPFKQVLSTSTNNALFRLANDFVTRLSRKFPNKDRLMHIARRNTYSICSGGFR